MTHTKTVGTMGLAWSISVHSYGIPKNLVALAMRGSIELTIENKANDQKEYRNQYEVRNYFSI